MATFILVSSVIAFLIACTGILTWIWAGGSAVKKITRAILMLAMISVISSLSVELGRRAKIGTAASLVSLHPEGVLEFTSVVPFGSNHFAIVREINKDDFLRDGRGAYGSQIRFYNLAGVNTPNLDTNSPAPRRFYLLEKGSSNDLQLIPVVPHWN